MKVSSIEVWAAIKAYPQNSLWNCIVKLLCVVESELDVLHGETPVHKYLPGDSFGE